MSILVQKYGGTSLADLECLNRVAQRISDAYEKGNRLVVVLSAMGKTTDALVAQANLIKEEINPRSMDLLLSTGEQISVALMQIALDKLAIPSVALTGAQAGFRVIGKHTVAHISSVDSRRVRQELEAGRVCLVAGFQGVDDEGEVYTLGRGGSDTSAVALAVSLGVSECEIFTDVDGVYTADPNRVSQARLLSTISYDEMLEFSRLGAGVLHNRSVELASKYGVEIRVSSSFHEQEGTIVVKNAKNLEDALVRGVSIKTDEARISLFDVSDSPGLAAQLFRCLAKEDINVDMIVQSKGKEQRSSISFTVAQRQLKKACQVVDSFLKANADFSDTPPEIEESADIAIVSVVGIGMQSHSGIAATMFHTLAQKNINIDMISTSEIKISVVVAREQGDIALVALHQAFGLDKDKK